MVKDVLLCEWERVIGVDIAYQMADWGWYSTQRGGG